eukprot:TRINITY_DN46849_c0_g1_i1.p1 TRINITY_DN46849_c0_g1~~TRINITY_DN46849_c0_g1_i1.p1  ORF type:complete len:1191 (+),score=437.73 TRINITY_DN46849_c0_g1_i1:66-3638(+)
MGGGVGESPSQDAIVQSLSEQQLKKLHEAFSAIDTNADGLLDRGEIMHLLRCSFPGRPAEELEEVCTTIIRTADRNADGSIDLSEFIRSVAAGEGVLPAEVVVTDDVTRRIYEMLTPEQVDGLKHCFMTIDENGDGFISFEELKKVLQKELTVRFPGLPEPTMDELVKLALQKADTDADGKLSLQEFVTSFTTDSGPVSNDMVSSTIAAFRRRLEDWEIGALKRTFSELDKNQDGYLDKDELRGALDEQLVARFPDMGEEQRAEMIALIVQTADIDGDGRLSIAEFLRSFAEEQGVLPPNFITKHAPEGCFQLDEAQIQQCVQAFWALDHDGNGTISLDELRSELHNVLGSFVMTDSEAVSFNEGVVKLATEHILKTADSDKNGVIDIKEFITSFQDTAGAGMLAQVGSVASDRVLHELTRVLERDQLLKIAKVFDSLDKNADGALQPEELNSVMHKLLRERVPELRDDPARREEVIRLIIETADKNNDGQLSLEEFVTAYYESSGVLPIDYVNKVAERLDKRLTREEVEALKAAFRKLDANADGFLDKDELRSLVMSVLHEYAVLDTKVDARDAEWLEQTVELIMSATDTDSDGKVSLTEFIGSFARDEGIGMMLTDHISTQAALAEQRMYEAEIAELNALMAEEELVRIVRMFDHLDKNGDEFLDRKELSKVMHKLLKERCPELRDSSDMRDQVIDTILAAADVDKDGKISLEEFIKSFYESSGVLPIDYVMDAAGRLAERITKEQAETLKAVFSKIDADSDGKITHDELKRVIGDVIVTESQETLDEIIDAIIQASDKNSDGVLDLTEFIRSFARGEGIGAVLTAVDELAQEAEQIAYEEAMRQLQELYTIDELRKMGRMFDHLDRDGDQKLDRNELSKVMHRLLKERVPELRTDEAKREQTIDILIRAADRDADGKLSFEEFVTSFYSDCGVLPLDYIHEAADKVSRRLPREEVEALKSIFQELDTNSDGVISPDELGKLLFDVGGPDEQTRKEVLGLIIQCSDTNQDGKIDLTEFIRSFARDEGVGAVIPHAMQARAAADSEVGTINAQPQANSGDQLPERAASPPPAGTRASMDASAPVGAPAPAAAPAGVVGPPRDSPSPFPNDVSGVSVTEDSLLQEFRRYDKDNSGYLSRKEFKKQYMALEWCGLEPSEREIDRLFNQFGGRDERLSYEEFCVLMLYRARI